MPEPKAGKNRLHLDLYPTRRDDGLTLDARMQVVKARVADLEGLGAAVRRRTHGDDPGDAFYYVVTSDPEGNEFCVS